MADKNNGSSFNGSGIAQKDDGKIVQFPDTAARNRAQKEKLEQEQAVRLSYKMQNKPAPFLNLSKIPVFTKSMVAVLILIQAGLSFLDEQTRYQIFYIFGFVPAYFSGAVSGFSKYAYLGPLTHMFIHAGWMHLAFNVITTLTFGILFERAFGARRMALFWFVCGLAGALVYFLLNPVLTAPVIGASGSISGLFAAAILLIHDRKSMTGAVRLPTRGPWPLIIFWLVFMIVTGMLSGDNTAWQAHAGGFIAGIGLYKFFQITSKKRVRF